jgi:hypothetical protein
MFFDKGRWSFTWFCSISEEWGNTSQNNIRKSFMTISKLNLYEYKET